VKFGIFYEHQLPRPWDGESEHKLFQDALSQVELADQLGIDHAWEVEHHFLEEYSHSSAPEVFLGAASQRTQNIRLGHDIVLMPPQYNHPARIAERIATLDLVSSGRVEWGTGESASRAELEGFAISPEHRRAMWRESVEQVANMLIWVACSNRDTIHLAAQLGIGALTFAFIDPAEAKLRVEDYYETFKNECVPIGHAVNPNIAMVTSFSVHNDHDEAVRRGLDGFRFFQFGLGHHYAFGEHRPGRTDIWANYERIRDSVGVDFLGGGTGGIGTPDEIARHLQSFADSGVDQTVFIRRTLNSSPPRRGNSNHRTLVPPPLPSPDRRGRGWIDF